MQLPTSSRKKLTPQRDQHKQRESLFRKSEQRRMAGAEEHNKEVDEEVAQGKFGIISHSAVNIR